MDYRAITWSAAEIPLTPMVKEWDALTHTHTHIYVKSRRHHQSSLFYLWDQLVFLFMFFKPFSLFHIRSPQVLKSIWITDDFVFVFTEELHMDYMQILMWFLPVFIYFLIKKNYEAYKSSGKMSSDTTQARSTAGSLLLLFLYSSSSCCLVFLSGSAGLSYFTLWY